MRRVVRKWDERKIFQKDTIFKIFQKDTLQDMIFHCRISDIGCTLNNRSLRLIGKSSKLGSSPYMLNCDRVEIVTNSHKKMKF